MNMRIKKLLKEIKELVIGKCKFDDVCEYYQNDSVTCNSQAGPYCGKYRTLEETW